MTYYGGDGGIGAQILIKNEQQQPDIKTFYHEEKIKIYHYTKKKTYKSIFGKKSFKQISLNSLSVDKWLHMTEGKPKPTEYPVEDASWNNEWNLPPSKGCHCHINKINKNLNYD